MVGCVLSQLAVKKVEAEVCIAPRALSYTTDLLFIQKAWLKFWIQVAEVI